MKEKEIIDVLLRVERLKEKYTCTFLVETDSWSQGFGGWQIIDKNGYDFWLKTIKNITGKNPDEATKEFTTGRAIADIFKIYGIGNANGTYWVVDKDGKPVILDSREKIEKYFKENRVSNRTEKEEGDCR